eukprot:8973133-Alexandrium_andersonii.AAC.1
MPVKQHWRDLGAHLDISGAGHGCTLDQRIRDVTQTLATAALLPQSTSRRVAVLRAKFLPGALYGIETTAARDPLIRKLRTATLAFLDPRMARSRNPAAAFEAFAALEQEADPLFFVAERRLLALRRHMAMEPAARESVQGLLWAYSEWQPLPGVVPPWGP